MPLAGQVEQARRSSLPRREQLALAPTGLHRRSGCRPPRSSARPARQDHFINLLPRLFDVTGGAVLVDGVDVREIDLGSAVEPHGSRAAAAYLFSGTIASNLRYGKPDATDDELWDALAIAQARDFVDEMPERLEAPTAQGGTNVRRQRQRLAIARALVKRPEIHVFDDSFSALDTATDRRLRAALAREVGDATVSIVAQRVSTIIDADHRSVEDGAVGAGGLNARTVRRVRPSTPRSSPASWSAEEAA
ncbi:MAG: ABC transporter ATP-binding protein [Schumannella sp.]